MNKIEVIETLKNNGVKIYKYYPTGSKKVRVKLTVSRSEEEIKDRYKNFLINGKKSLNFLKDYKNKKSVIWNIFLKYNEHWLSTKQIYKKVDKTTYEKNVIIVGKKPLGNKTWGKIDYLIKVHKFNLK